ncbi:MAG: hypothetical protein KGJ86_09380, partial [Chloroflexota bacterium]|nr:hypothetical protein [Chloroflexota bacterium]
MLSLLAASCGAAGVPAPPGTPPVPVATQAAAQPTPQTAALKTPAPSPQPASGAPGTQPQAAGAPAGVTNPCGPTAFNGQSNLVPAGFPTPTTAGECLKPNGPPRDPGPLTWAKAGPYISPSWNDFHIASFSATQRIATTYYFYWHDLTDRTAGEARAVFSGRFD